MRIFRPQHAVSAAAAAAATAASTSLSCSHDNQSSMHTSTPPYKQVCGQLPASADNQRGTSRICCVTCCGAAATHPPAVQRSIDISRPPSPQQQTRKNNSNQNFKMTITTSNGFMHIKTVREKRKITWNERINKTVLSNNATITQHALQFYRREQRTVSR